MAPAALEVLPDLAILRAPYVLPDLSALLDPSDRPILPAQSALPALGFQPDLWVLQPLKIRCVRLALQVLQAHSFRDDRVYQLFFYDDASSACASYAFWSIPVCFSFSYALHIDMDHYNKLCT